MIYNFEELTLSKRGNKEVFYIAIDGDIFISTNYLNMPTPTHSKVGRIVVIHNSAGQHVVSKIIDYLLNSKIIFNEKICGDILYSWN